MKIRCSVAALLALTVLLAPALARAQCDFNSPDKAKSAKISMVRAFYPCGGITFPIPNTATSEGTPACAPPPPSSSYTFLPKGSCSVKVTHKLEDPCSTGSPGACANVSIKAKCKGIGESDGVAPISAGVWALNVTVRRTTNDSFNGDITVIDFPAQFAFGLPQDGKIQLKIDTNAYFETLFGPGNETGGCTTYQMLSMTIVGPSGTPFAVPGTSSK